MNPGLIVKLRPSGPWRIGSDSGAANRVDSVYHSDSLYSAVAWAMARLGMLEEWLEATARAAEPAVSFSSCFPFLEEVLCVVPPRTVWPPSSAGLSARVRWKSARFVPLEAVRSLLAGRKLDEALWTLDGPSECLTPAGRPGPFRDSVRWSAAVDRLTGSVERHSTACIEFRSGCGLWTAVSFLDPAARDVWRQPVVSAFRLLADSGFGGERSRGWGRSEPPEFIEGDLPDLILPPAPQPTGLTDEAILDQLVADLVGPAASEQAPEPIPAEPSEPTPENAPESAGESMQAPAVEPHLNGSNGSNGMKAEAERSAEAPAEITGGVAVLEAEEEAEETQVEFQPAEPEPQPQTAIDTVEAPQSHWLLSLYTPAPGDAVDWHRGNYAVLTRGGRVESPAGSGAPKKQLQMIAEGSVLSSKSEPRGAATDVRPDGFPHPVYRAGFAVAIPLPEVR
jgi:CRISPR type III-A-associated RAMP protein Csm4